MRNSLVMALLALAAISNCTGTLGSGNGTGGGSATGGSSGTGGSSATGGNSGTGGSTATGGSSATGGNSGTGGSSGTGGGSATGGGGAGFGSVTKTVTYTEPTSKEGGACQADGGVLNDLKHTTIYYRVNSGATVTAATVPASAPAGGGNISRQITINKATSGTDHGEVWVSATNTADQESTDGCSARVTFDF